VAEKANQRRDATRLEMASRPWRWWLMLWRVPTDALLISGLLGLVETLTREATSGLLFMMVWHEASFLDS